ncbi:MAG: FHA domain-containing protein, partial [Oligoflexia bacterium]|nr:FHA domain-containing protein [Oligoflexia bacterium]
MQYLSLKIFKDSKLIKTKIFTDDQISIGSSEGLSLQLEGLSPWHVLIEKKHDIFCILDLNSETGTRLNGQAVTDETPLQSGSVIHIGSYEVHFFVGPPVEKTAPTGKAKPSVEKPVKTEKRESSAQESKVSEKLIFNEAERDFRPPSFIEKEELLVPDVKKESDQVETVLRPDPKADKKGFWKTYAPSSRINNLDDYLEPSIGNLIEVSLCWKERVLRAYYFF